MLNLKLEDNSDQCKGLFFRYRLNSHWNQKRNEYTSKETFSLLKKKSCEGCEQCGWILDDIGEMDSVLCESELKDGDVTMLTVVNIERDWETGVINDWNFKFCKAD